jgi:LCP family protein required for cell wall assembly
MPRNRFEETDAYTGETIVIPRRRAGAPRPAARRAGGRLLPRLRLALLAAAGLLLLLLGLLYWQIHRAAGQIVERDVRPGAALAAPLTGANVLLIGVDERPGHPEEGVRSDTLIVAHLDTAGRWVNLLSIPRDTLVELPELGPSKINAAYAFGYNQPEATFGPGVTPRQAGMALAAQTVERLLAEGGRPVRIDYVAQINFDGFAALVDALGGVEIDVPKAIVDDEYPTPDFGTMRIEFQPGVQRMNGERALQYARTRHADSDFDRSARQQQVIRAILDELRRRGPIGQALAVPRLLGAAGGAVATTMPIDRPDVLLGLAWLGSGLRADEIGRFQLSPELDPNVAQGPNYELTWSPAGLRAAVDALLARPRETAEQARVQVLNGTDIAGLARDISGRLADAGFTVLPAGDAPESGVARTVVYDRGGAPRTSRRLAEVLHAELRRGAAPGVASDAEIVVILGQDAAR